MNNPANAPVRGAGAHIPDQWEVRAAAEKLRSETAAPTLGAIFAPIGRWFGGMGRSLGRLGEAIARARIANELSMLDERTLADIGLKRSDIPSLFTGDRAVSGLPEFPARERPPV